jgi:hypothetical protein
MMLARCWILLLFFLTLPSQGALRQSRKDQRRELEEAIQDDIETGENSTEEEGSSWWDSLWPNGDDDDQDHHGGDWNWDNGTNWSWTTPDDDSWWGNSTVDDVMDYLENATEGWFDEHGNWTDGEWWGGDNSSGFWDDYQDDYGGMDDLFHMIGSVPVGAMNAMFALFANWSTSVDYGDLECPASGTSNNGGPTCASNLNGEVGAWVCRSLFNPFNGERQSITLCADANMTIGAVDVCGCCGEACPQVCECPCTSPDGEEGVRVWLNATMMGESEPWEVCMDSAFAVSIIGSVNDTLSCVTNCSSSVENPPFMSMPGGRRTK